MRVCVRMCACKRMHLARGAAETLHAGLEVARIEYLHGCNIVVSQLYYYYNIVVSQLYYYYNSVVSNYIIIITSLLVNATII